MTGALSLSFPCPTTLIKNSALFRGTSGIPAMRFYGKVNVLEEAEFFIRRNVFLRNRRCRPSSVSDIFPE